MRHFLMVLCLSTVAFATIALQKSQAKESARDQDLKLMQETLASYRILLPLSLSAETFNHKKNHKLIVDHLRLLAQSSQKVRQHFSQAVGERRFLANSLAYDAREALRLFEAGNKDGARFVLHHISENCVSCHSKIPSKPSQDTIRNLYDDLKSQKISGVDLAHFLVMLRSFEEAIKTYETEFLNNPDLLESKAFGEYLKLQLRVLRNPNELVKFLTKFEEKKLPLALTKKIAKWKRSAEDLVKSKALTKSSLTEAERLIEKGQKLQDYPQDNSGIVYLIGASAILEKILSTKDLSDESRSEAYYWAGVIESHLSHSLWINELEYYLELAVTTAPRSPWAKKALKKLEEEYVIGYSGSSGTHIPEDVKAHLNELKKKTEAR